MAGSRPRGHLDHGVWQATACGQGRHERRASRPPDSGAGGCTRRLPVQRVWASEGAWGISRAGGLVTLPERMHDVQAWMCVEDPPTKARTRWMFGSHRRFVRRWEWLTLIPNEGFLPQTSQTAAMMCRLPLEAPRGSGRG